MAGNMLYYGDNLYWLRRMQDETVDLIYLDPPFNSNRSYNVLFKDERGSESEAQIMAFEDTWHWNPATSEAYAELVDTAPSNVVHMIAAMRQFIGANQMMAYLVMMTVRLVELRRVLKPTGSLYLHCDPTASHYLKIILDAIFGPQNYQNEIVWRRTAPKGLMTQRLPRTHDILFCYQASEQAKWNMDVAFIPYDAQALDDKTASKYHYKELDGRIYRLDNLINPNPDRPNLTYEFLGITKVWRWTKERMQAAYDAGLVVQTKPGSVPQLKRYLDGQRGRPLTDVWTDIDPINSQAQERLGYPTQKPLALLERIISASSHPGDVVLDPFCGCGTAIMAAQKLGRQWIGIDITHLSIALMKYRLESMFPGVAYGVEGEPEDMGAARKLAQDDRYQFQFWACSLVRAKPLGGEVGSRSGKKGSDRGVDGLIDFEDDASGALKKVVVQVKSGKVQSPQIRELLGTIQREQAELGVFISLEEPTRDMRSEAAMAGFYESAWGRHPRLQLLTIEDLIDRKHPARVDMPPRRQTDRTFKRAERAQAQSATAQLSLLDDLEVYEREVPPPDVLEDALGYEDSDDDDEA